MNFNELNLSDQVIRGLEAMGFEEPTPVQAQTIPLIIEGKDVIGHSQTGTGKTAAFGIPAIESIDTQSKAVQVLILCPTRELAVQSCEEIKKFSKYKHGIKAVAIFGGQPIERQIKDLKHGVQIVIGTPGRVMDHMRRRTLKLQNVKMVVLDEADEMLNMGFREDIETILQEVPQERQTVLFSATMSKEILRITNEYLSEPEHVKIQSKELTISAIEQTCYQIPKGRKPDVLVLVLEKYQPNLAMVFCNTKKQVDEIVSSLQQRGIKADGIHGDIKQATRINVLTKFKTGKVKVLVATDVAARGIDIDGIDIVINYDIPQDLEYYVHRIGRTGRAGRSGRSFTFVSGSRQMSEIRDIERFTKAKIKLEPLPTMKEVEQSKINKFTEDVTKVISKGGLEDYTEAVNALTDLGYTHFEIAQALTKLVLGKRIEKIKVDNIEPPKAYVRSNSPKPDMTKIKITIGKESKISAGHIVAAVAGDGKISGDEIGDIKISSNYSIVEVPKDRASEIIKNMKRCRIKGKNVIVEKHKQ